MAELKQIRVLVPAPGAGKHRTCVPDTDTRGGGHKGGQSASV